MKTITAITVSLIMINNLLSQNFNAVDSLLAEYDQEYSPGASLMLIKNDKIIYQKNYGLANLEENIRVTSLTNFRLASVTKQFTASSILLLINNGKLTYDSKLTEIFPGFPGYGNEISVRNLLNHTSGLIDYEDLIADSASIQVKDKDVLEMMKQQDSTYFKPGSRFRYSNTAYALLAMIVEQLSEKSFPDFLKENIFDPAGMKSSIAYVDGINEVSNRAYGYSLINDEYIRTDQSITSAVLGDGGIYSNVEDLYKWIRILQTDELLPRELLNASISRGKLNNGDEIDYGFGWHLVKNNNSEIIYHTGSTLGFRNIIYRIPSEGITLILLTNKNQGSEKDSRKLAEAIIKSLEI